MCIWSFFLFLPGLRSVFQSWEEYIPQAFASALPKFAELLHQELLDFA